MATAAFSASLQITATGATFSGDGSVSVAIAGNAYMGHIQTIGATTEALAFVDIATMGYLLVKNLDVTNFVMIGLATPVVAGAAFAHLKPGEVCLVPTRQAVIYAIADTAPCDCLIVATEL